MRNNFGSRIGRVFLVIAFVVLCCTSSASQSTYERDLQRLMNPSGKD